MHCRNIDEFYFLIVSSIIFIAIAGSAVTYGCTPSVVRGNIGATVLSQGVKVGHGFALEMIFTFILVFFVFSITDPLKKVEPYGTTLGIGICIMVAHVCLVSHFVIVKRFTQPISVPGITFIN